MPENALFSKQMANHDGSDMVSQDYHTKTPFQSVA